MSTSLNATFPAHPSFRHSLTLTSYLNSLINFCLRPFMATFLKLRIPPLSSRPILTRVSLPHPSCPTCSRSSSRTARPSPSSMTPARRWATCWTRYIKSWASSVPSISRWWWSTSRASGGTSSPCWTPEKRSPG